MVEHVSVRAETLHRALPQSATIEPGGILSIGGCRVDDLAVRFGTPLYIYDVETIRRTMRACVGALAGGGALYYAGKAYLAPWLMRLATEEHVGLDVCSGIELEMALRSGFPASRIRLHGNYKSVEVLRLAVNADIGAVVVDSLPELRGMIEVCSHERRRVRIFLRLNPGISAHTHRYLQTGIVDSKFGLSMVSSDAYEAVGLAQAHQPQLELIGYHAHIGTQILDLDPYSLLLQRLKSFAVAMQEAHGFWPQQISPGGGIGITYTHEVAPNPAMWLKMLRQELEAFPAPAPHISMELGRAISGPAGVALYRVGSIKEAPGHRTYVAIDGGMADNIRPALYEARYAVVAANRMDMAACQTVTIAGPYCESGDIVASDVATPTLIAGDLLALPAAGAYCLPMSSNYNGALRPAVVTVDQGQARLVQRRQTLSDLLAVDID